ncbi:MAG: bifunctional proline dehydrogenase/L-glutamate gamma-semialdehyde dehydrogenase PutA [Rickettsiales endosymbiont of Dermacentor nuttalli]
MKSFNQLIDISNIAFSDEPELLQKLQEYNEIFKQKYDIINAKAKQYINSINDSENTTIIDQFINEYNLTNEEGIAIMCLAEALLRIPDKATMDELIADKCGNAEWLKHIGQDKSNIVNAVTIGLSMAGKLLSLDKTKSLLGSIVRRVSDPVIRAALKKVITIMGQKFVIGENIEQALKNSNRHPNYMFSYDILGEGARSQEQAEFYFDHYLRAIDAIGDYNSAASLNKNTSISIKLSSLHPRYELLKKNRLVNELIPTLKCIITHAKNKGISVTIDAEEASRLDISLLLFEELFTDEEFVNYNGLGMAVQAYQKRAPFVIDYLADLAKKHNKIIPIRLVKGAYWDSEIKKSQMLGLEGFSVYTNKYHTDFSYLACANKMFGYSNYIYPQFATHNALTVASIISIADGRQFEFQCLYGMGKPLYDYIIEHEKVNCRIYAPVGNYHDLLCYLIRRLIENGANNSFVHMFASNATEEELLQDPIKFTIQNNFLQSQEIKSPKTIYQDNRENSSGFDLGNMSQLENIREQVTKFMQKTWEAYPIINGKPIKDGEVIRCMQPGDLEKEIGKMRKASEKDCDRALDVSVEAFAYWSSMAIKKRSAIIEKIADVFQENYLELATLLMGEGGKTIADAIAEIREAIDFCRYYACESRKLMQNGQKFVGYTGESNELSLHARGVFVCISPWNFPLAIFTGQVVAALVVGNTVIAKPALQTSLIACLAVKLMHEAGVPDGALQFLPAQGSLIGNYLLKDPRIAGVAFTGSTETARSINRTLAGRDADIVPFIAETGGQNCMIVDSSALIEQTVDDIIQSAFGSSGQRCSALRVLYVQEEIADKLINLLVGAMRELTIGDTHDLSIDIGPVIDRNSQDILYEHIKKMKESANFLYATEIEDEFRKMGYFVPPHAFEIKSINELSQEVFGPVLHIIRYNSKNLDQVIDEINSTGYGLTFGIQSRIAKKIEYIRDKVKVGNIYVNRSTIGAVVGLQPFGGERASGTGPKAGGPHYLLRFMLERCCTINTAAIGGNLELFS